MKTLILGDLHGRLIWKDIIEKENPDRVIFLGDYTCPKEVHYEDPTDLCSLIYELLDYKDNNKDKVILLRGNHDLAVLGYSWAECFPKDHPKVEVYMRTNDVKNWFLQNTQWIYIIPRTNIVCSHAGIGKLFLDECVKRCSSEHKSTLKQISEINSLMPSELFGFTPYSLSDYNGISPTQPCTWIRPQTLFTCSVENITQVIGHTPVTYICNIKDVISKHSSPEENKNYPDIWCCDCLDRGQYLIIEDNTFIPKTLEI